MSGENISAIKLEFLAYLGIDLNNLPDGIHNEIKHYRHSLTEQEQAFSDPYVAGQSRERFSIRDVVGTNHDRYAGKTWLKAFLDTNKWGDRMDGNIEMFFLNPEYYEDMRSPDSEVHLTLVRKGDEYFLPGEGNNRMIITKLNYLAASQRANGDESKMAEIDEEFTFYGNIQNLPKEQSTVNAIDFLTYWRAMGSMTQVRNVSCPPKNWKWNVMLGNYSFGDLGEKQLQQLYQILKQEIVQLSGSLVSGYNQLIEAFGMLGEETGKELLLDNVFHHWSKVTEKTSDS